MEPDVSYLEYLIKGLVESPDDVRVDRSTDERGVLMEVSVGKHDMGKVIGKGGSTATAIRNIMRVFGRDAHISLKFLEPA